jgi:hypothetical protein
MSHVTPSAFQQQGDEIVLLGDRAEAASIRRMPPW